MVLGALFFSIMAVLVKVAGRRIPSQEIVLARALVTLALSWVTLRRAGVSPWGHNRRLLLVRGLAGFGALSCYFFALTELPLADATVIQYTSPVFTAVFAALALREAIGRLEAGAILTSLVGVTLVAQPSFLFAAERSLAPAGVAVALVGAVFAGIAYTTVRHLRATEHPVVIVFYFSLVATPGSVPWLAAGAVWPVGWEWLVLLGVGVATQLGQVHLTRGLHLVPAGRAMSVTYLQIVFAHAWGIVLFAEYPNAWSLLGAGLVLVATTVVARGSQRRK
jgi:drug/metabolite transporter (DMT)-like permease